MTTAANAATNPCTLASKACRQEHSQELTLWRGDRHVFSRFEGDQYDAGRCQSLEQYKNDC